MRIGIDARMLGKGYGIGRYIEQLILQLGEQPSEYEFVIFVTKIPNSKFQIPNSTFIECGIPWYSVKEQLAFSNIIKAQHIDLMHFTHWNVPLLYPDPFVVTVHDLTMFHHARPEATTRGPLAYWLKDQAHRLVVRNAVKRAKRIITVSDWVAQDIHDTFGTPTEKMTTMYQGIDPAFHRPASTSSTQEPYVLYVGSAYPHKNIDRLLGAWAQVVAQGEDHVRLVLAGKRTPFWERSLERMPGSIRASVDYIDFVPDQDLPALYAGALACIYPSLSEGFGLPPLEAMACGTPVVSSSSTCLPEVLGDAALYVDPYSEDDIARGIITIIQDADMRAALRAKGLQQVAQYDLSTFGAKTLDIYDKILFNQ